MIKSRSSTLSPECTPAAQAVDIVVLGGGPAGAALAILTARAGASVLLVERSDYGSRRVGEHLAPTARGALAALEIDPETLKPCLTDSPGIATSWIAGQPPFRPYPPNLGLGANLDRARFDRLLAQTAVAAGAVVIDQAKVTALDRHAAGWRFEVAAKRERPRRPGRRRRRRYGAKGLARPPSGCTATACGQHRCRRGLAALRLRTRRRAPPGRSL